MGNDDGFDLLPLTLKIVQMNTDNRNIDSLICSTSHPGLRSEHLGILILGSSGSAYKKKEGPSLLLVMVDRLLVHCEVTLLRLPY